MKKNIKISVAILLLNVVATLGSAIVNPSVANAARICEMPRFEVIVRDVTDPNNVVQLGTFQAGRKTISGPLFQPDSNPYPPVYEIQAPTGHTLEYIRHDFVTNNYYYTMEGQYEDIEYTQYDPYEHFLAGHRHEPPVPPRTGAQGHQEDPWQAPEITNGEYMETKYTAPPLEGELSIFRAERGEGINLSWCSGGTDENGHPIFAKYYTELQIFVTPSDAPPALNCTISRTVTQGQTASYDINAEVGSYNGDVNVTLTSPPSSPTNPRMTNSPLVLRPSNLYTGTANISTTNVAPGTYPLTFTGTRADNISSTCTPTLIVDPGGQPQVDLKVNGSDAPDPVADGDTVDLTWDTQNADTCTATTSPATTPNSWSGNKATANTSTNTETSARLNSANQPFTFTLTCSNGTLSESDSVTVYVNTTVPRPTVTLHCSQVGGGDDTPADLVGDNGDNTADKNGEISDNAKDDNNTIEPIGNKDEEVGGGIENLTPSETCDVNWGAAGTLSWSSANATACSLTADPSTNPSGTVATQNSGTPTDNIYQTTDFTATCTGPGGTSDPSTVRLNVIASPTFTMTCTPASPTVTAGTPQTYRIELDSVQGFAGSVNLSATITAPLVINPGGDDGGGTPGMPIINFPTNNLVPNPHSDAYPVVTTYSNTPTGTYTINITAQSGGITRTCAPNLNVTPLTPPVPPSPPIVSNVTPPCGSLDITWTNDQEVHPNPTAYRLYHRTSVTSPWVKVGADVFWRPLGNYSVNHNQSPPLSLTGPNFYGLSAVYGASESTKTLSSPLFANTIACSPNLSLSDKDLTTVSGKTNSSFTTTICNGPLNPDTVRLPNNALFSPDDVVSFRINVCNTGTQALTEVKVTDFMTNLSNPTNIQVSPVSCISGIIDTDLVGGPQFTVNLEDIPVGTASNPSICSITFDAKVTAPSTVNASLYRFQNRAVIQSRELPDHTVYTPPYLFTIGGGVPVRNETGPQGQVGAQKN